VNLTLERCRFNLYTGLKYEQSQCKPMVEESVIEEGYVQYMLKPNRVDLLERPTSVEPRQRYSDCSIPMHMQYCVSSDLIR